MALSHTDPESACELIDSSARVRGLIQTLSAEFQILQQRSENVIHDNRELQEQLSFLEKQEKSSKKHNSKASLKTNHQHLPPLILSSMDMPSKESTATSDITLESTWPNSDEISVTTPPATSWKQHAPPSSGSSRTKQVWQGLVSTPMRSPRFGTPRRLSSPRRASPRRSPKGGSPRRGSPRRASPGHGPIPSTAVSSPVTPKEAPMLDDTSSLDIEDDKERVTHKIDISGYEKNGSGSGIRVSFTSSAAKKETLKTLATMKTLSPNERSTATKMLLLDTIPAVVILANACTIGMSADINPESDVWNILEGCWIVCYSIEFVVKVKIFGLSQYFRGPDRHWNWFDFTCLAVSIFDITMQYLLQFVQTPGGATGLMKTLRLARLARIVRALHYSFFDELKQMLLGVVSGVRVLFWAIVLLLVCIFFVGVGMNSLIGDKEEELETVPQAMITVFRCFTDGCTDFHGRPLQKRLLDRYGVWFFFGYILAFMFVSVGIFNLIMAIFIDNVFVRSLKRRLMDIGNSAIATELRVKDTLTRLIIQYAIRHPHWDQAELLPEELSTPRIMNSGICITRKVFSDWLSDPQTLDMLETSDIETAAKAELFDVMDVDMGGELGLDELLSGLMRLRGPITKTDIVAVRLKVRYVTSMIEDIWRRTFKTPEEEAKTASVHLQEDSNVRLNELLYEKRKSTVHRLDHTTMFHRFDGP